MNVFVRWFRKLAIFIRGEQFRNELEEEMAFHREEAERELAADGMEAKEAQHAARRRLGNEALLRDQSQEAVSFWFEGVLQDFRFALRQLCKNPGFAATAILILALGMGAGVAIFGFVDAALIKPLPYKNPSRLVGLYESIPLGPRFHLSYPDYLDWKRMNTGFQSLDVYAPYGFTLSDANGAQQVDGASVSATFFRTLGVTPILGRDFHPDEDRKNAARAVILSYGAWQRRYGGRRDVLGQTVVLDSNPATIVGVLPREFHFAPAEPADYYETLQSHINDCRGCHPFWGIARLKDGVSYNAAYDNIKAIAFQLEKEYPGSNRDQHAYMLPLTEVILGDIRPILLVLLAGAALLLLIAAVNVSSLLLVRSESRRREIAVRGALGASRGRLMRQFITEGLVLVSAGSLLGIALATWVMQIFARHIPREMMDTMPYLRGLGLNGRVLLFACAISLATGVVFSLVPMLRMSWAEIRAGLSEGGRGSAGVMWRRFGTNMVVIELMTAMVLLVSAGLLGKSFYRLLHVDIGMQPDHLAVMQIGAPQSSYPKDPQVIAMTRRVVAGIAALPGVKSVGVTQDLPIGTGDDTTQFRVVGRPYHGQHDEVAIRGVNAAYFATLRTQLLHGRYFIESEDETKPRVVIINEAFARTYFPGENPVGRELIFNSDSPQPHMQIVGVINDIKEGQLDAEPRAAMYVPFYQRPDAWFSMVVRTTGAERSLLHEMSAAVHQIDPNIATYNLETMGDRIHDSPSSYLHRSSAWIVGGFAAIALVLSVAGLYGVIAYSVSRRTREIGVRMALGAQRAAVYSLILGEAGRLVIMGIGIGIALSIAAAMLMRRLLFGVQAWDAPTLIVVAAVLAAAALAASFVPAYRAATVNPVEALRAE